MTEGTLPAASIILALWNEAYRTDLSVAELSEEAKELKRELSERVKAQADHGLNKKAHDIVFKHGYAQFRKGNELAAATFVMALEYELDILKREMEKGGHVGDLAVMAQRPAAPANDATPPVPDNGAERLLGLAELPPADDPAPAADEAPKKQRGRPKGTKNKPKGGDTPPDVAPVADDPAPATAVTTEAAPAAPPTAAEPPRPATMAEALTALAAGNNAEPPRQVAPLDDEEDLRPNFLRKPSPFEGADGQGSYKST